MARGSWRAGSARSLAVNVTTPNPRKAKNVQRDAGHDVAERRVAREGEEIGIEVGERRHGEHGEDADHDDDDDGLGPRHGSRPDDVDHRHRHHDQHGEGLGPRLSAIPHDRAGVAAEGHGDHAGDDGVGGEDQPGDDAGDVAVAEPADDVLEQATCRRVPGAELGEGVALQPGDGAGDEERQPHGRPGDLARCAEEGEDPRADHRADADERRLTHAERPGCRGDVGHRRATITGPRAPGR